MFPSTFRKKQKKEQTYFINDDYEMSPVRTLSESAMTGKSEYFNGKHGLGQWFNCSKD